MTIQYTNDPSVRSTRAPQSVNNCFTCKHRISFTPSEKDYSLTLLSDIGYQGRIIGGCSYKDRCSEKDKKDGKYPPVIRLYITKPIVNCSRWEKGDYYEETGYACPKCETGDLRIVRLPDDNKNIHIVLGCSDHVKCRFTTKALRIEQCCEYCDTNLNLVIKDQMYCECPQCNRRFAVPFTLANQPLLNNDQRCVHGSTTTSCRICSACLSNHKNLTDLEIDKVLYWNSPSATATTVDEYYDRIQREGLEF
jgi:ssDNA-binding Zn-finger/Zn-ribbon topoisomerase 1